MFVKLTDGDIYETNWIEFKKDLIKFIDDKSRTFIISLSLVDVISKVHPNA